MEQKLARYLLLLVNDKEMYDRFQALVQHKIERHLKHLETTKDTVRIFEIQGAIAELRRFEHIRAEIIEAAG